MFWLNSLNLQADQTYEIGVDLDQQKRQKSVSAVTKMQNLQAAGAPP